PWIFGRSTHSRRDCALLLHTTFSYTQVHQENSLARASYSDQLLWCLFHCARSKRVERSCWVAAGGNFKRSSLGLSGQILAHQTSSLAPWVASIRLVTPACLATHGDVL